MKHGIKITLNSPVVLLFGLLCVLATLFNYISGGYANIAWFVTYRSSLRDYWTYLRLFTHVLGHSGWTHLIGNMSYILLIGPLLEEKYGSKVIIYIILAVALSTALFNALLFPGSGLLGASGVVFAFILLSSFTGAKSGEIPLTFILVAGIYLGQQIYQGVFLTDNVANFAHIIGGIVGAVTGFVSIGRKR